MQSEEGWMRFQMFPVELQACGLSALMLDICYRHSLHPKTDEL